MIIYFLPAILLLGIVTSIGDIKSGRIHNKYILSALSYSFLINLAIGLAFNLSLFPLDRYFYDLLLNVLISSIFGFILSSMVLWSSGDGKLFTAYSSLLPLSAYSLGYIPWFPSFTIFVNTFLIGLVYLLYKSIVLASRAQRYLIFSRTLKSEPLIELLMYLYGFSWIISTILDVIGIGPNPLTYIVGFLLIFKLFERRINMVYLAILLSMMHLTSDMRNPFFLTEFLKSMALFFVPISLAIRFISESGFSISTSKISFEGLESGMILSEDVMAGDNSRVKVSKEHVSSPEKDGLTPIGYGMEGITQEDIELLERLRNDGKLKANEFSVYHTIPFAPLMFSGVLLTIIVNGDFITYLQLNLRLFF